MINSYLWCPEQKQPNGREWRVMEAGSSFEKIDNSLNMSHIQIVRCKNNLHSLPYYIAKNRIGGQKEDRKFCG